MSATWRKNNQREPNPSDMPIHSNDHDDIVGTYLAYDPTPQTTAYYLGGNQPLDMLSARFPGQREIFHPEADRYTPATGVMDGQGNDTYNLIDREIGGQRGWINDLPYSTGVVSSDLVEDFNLDGRQAVIRRQGTKQGVGPVGTSDSNGRLALLYAQAVNEYFPNEASQADLVRAV